MDNTRNIRREVDIVEIILLLWSKRKRFIINCFIGGVLSIIVAFSIPKQYTSTVVLAPEFSSGASLSSGGIGALASMAGLNLGGLSGSEDALYPELYPQIVSSTPFLCELLNLQIEANEGELQTTLYDYLVNHQKEPWWVKILGAPGKLLSHMLGKDTLDVTPPSLDATLLSRRQFLTVKSLDEKIAVNVDKGNSVITLDVTMQDAKLAAYVVSVVSENLQEYIGQYRSAKARKDLAYTEQLYSEVKEKYYKAQQKYAEYADMHQGVVKMKYQIEQDRLSNEQELAFNVYNQIAQQLEMARAKVAESTPVCVVMQPAVVPIKASSPKKMMMGLLYVFLAFFGTAAWMLVDEYVISPRVAKK